MRLRTCLAALLLCLADTCPAQRVVAYLASWSAPPVIDVSGVTHVNVAFAHIAAGRIVIDASTATALRRLTDLRRQRSDLKIILSVGGWQAEGFSDAALSANSRRRFAASALARLSEFQADGLDLDWEYPGQGVAGIKYRSADRANFTALLRQLRQALDASGRRYLLTIAAADREYFEHAEVAELHRYLDWINVMAYDFHNSLTPTTGHHAGLYASRLAAPNERTADRAIRQYLSAGVPADKLVLGVAFYGRGFTGVRPDNRGLDQPYATFEGEHAYADLVARYIGRRGFETFWDEVAQAPYLWNAATRTFVSYDDPRSIALKSRYALKLKLGGVMFWELSEDKDGALKAAVLSGLLSSP